MVLRWRVSRAKAPLMQIRQTEKCEVESDDDADYVDDDDDDNNDNDGDDDDNVDDDDDDKDYYFRSPSIGPSISNPFPR